MDFVSTLRGIRLKSGISRYRLAHWSGINELYIYRLVRTDGPLNPMYGFGSSVN